MIDLHIHTVHSDGSDTVLEILKKAQNIGLEIISITDHDSVMAYYDLNKIDANKYFSGKIISGVEFTTTFDGYTTEILGYGCDYKKINKALKNFYTARHIEKEHKKQMSQLSQIITKHNLTFDFKNKKNCLSYKTFFEELSRYPENHKLVKNEILKSFGNFIRKGYANPKSDFYVDKTTAYLKFEDIIEIIHKAGGKAFLAHPFIYQFDDTKTMLEKIFSSTKLDGVECYYHSFTDEQTKLLLDFAKQKNLLICGGTDYHGDIRPQSKLGIGAGNLCIENNILDNWHIQYYC